MSSGPPPLPSIPLYEARLTYFDKICVYRILGDQLQVEEEGRLQNLPLSDITGIRCRFFPTRFQLDRYEIIITFSTGLNLKIGNQLFRGIADFEDRSPAFRSFVIALHQARMKVAPPCRFFAGITPLSFWLSTLIISSIVILLVALILIFPSSFSGVILVKLAIFIVMIPIAINWFRKNKPREYQGNAIPPDVLPSESH
ncbi:hypothetical protein V2O64_16400 [Verrucomicrobiaceae bacterium 227]